MPRAVPSPSRREQRSLQFTAPGQASPSPAAASSNTRLAGLIVWFPARNEVGDPPRGSLDACYDHPCVILSPVLGPEDVVTVLPMTSFSSRDLRSVFPRSSQAAKRKHYIPIAPAPAHPDTDEVLHLRDPGRMELRKKSYLNVRRPYLAIPFAVLRPFHGRHSANMVLSTGSYQLVIERVGFAAPPPPPAAAPRLAAPEPGPVAVQPCRIAADPLPESRPVCHPPPSYDTLPAYRTPRPSHGGSATRGSWRAPGSRAGGAAGPRIAAGWVACVVGCILWASAVFLLAYGVYWGVAKSIETAGLLAAWVRNSVGAGAEAVRGALYGVCDAVAHAGDGTRGAWEALVGWARRAVGSIEV